MRQGWKIHCIKRLICKTLDKTAAQDAQKARWCSKRNKVILAGNVKQEQHEALLDKRFIKRRLGMTAWEIEAELKEASDMAAMGINMSELQPGSFGAFEFNKDQSTKMTRTSKTKHA